MFYTKLTFIIVVLLTISCTTTKHKRIDNTIFIRDYKSIPKIKEDWYASEFKLIQEFKESYRNDILKEKVISNYESGLEFAIKYSPKDENDSFDCGGYFLKLLLKEKIKNRGDTSTKYFLLEFGTQGELIIGYNYVEVMHDDNSIYYKYYCHEPWNYMKIEDSTKRNYLKCLFYLSKQMQNERMNKEFKHYASDERGLTITMFDKNSVTSNIIMFYNEEQYNKIRYLYSRIDSLLSLRP